MSDQPNLSVSNHPAVLHKLALLRDERTDPKKFRELVREISWLVGYEALADTPLNDMNGAADKVGVAAEQLQVTVDRLTEIGLMLNCDNPIWDLINIEQ